MLKGLFVSQQGTLAYLSTNLVFFFKAWRAKEILLLCAVAMVTGEYALSQTFVPSGVRHTVDVPSEEIDMPVLECRGCQQSAYKCLAWEVFSP